MEKELTLQELKANKFQLSMYIKRLIEDFEKNNQVKVSNIQIEIGNEIEIGKTIAKSKEIFVDIDVKI